MQNLEAVLDSFGKTLVTDVRASLKAVGVVSGGGQDSTLGAKTKFEVKYTNDGLEFDLLMPEYWYWVQNGREPGDVSKEGQESIAEWAAKKGIIGKFQKSNLEKRLEKQRESKRKGLKKLKKLPFEKAKKQLTYLVSRKITKDGYEGKDFLGSVLNDGRLNKLSLEVSALIGKQIKFELKV